MLDKMVILPQLQTSLGDGTMMQYGPESGLKSPDGWTSTSTFHSTKIPSQNAHHTNNASSVTGTSVFE